MKAKEVRSSLLLVLTAAIWGVAYTLQVVAQPGLNPTVASLIMSFEAVFGTLAGWIILKQTMSAREITGCVLMFVAIVLAQLPLSKRKEL